MRSSVDDSGGGVDLATFKQALRDQFLMLLLDPEAALACLPKLLEAASPAEIRPALDDIRSVATASGPLDGKAQDRLVAIEAIFEEAAARGAAGGSPAEAVGEAVDVAVSAPDPGRLAAVTKPAPRRRAS